VPTARDARDDCRRALNFPLQARARVTVRDFDSYEKDRVSRSCDAHDVPREYRGDFVIACYGPRICLFCKRAALAQDRIMQASTSCGPIPGPFPRGLTARGYIGHGHLLIM